MKFISCLLFLGLVLTTYGGIPYERDTVINGIHKKVISIDVSVRPPILKGRGATVWIDESNRWIPIVNRRLREGFKIVKVYEEGDCLVIEMILMSS